MKYDSMMEKVERNKDKYMDELSEKRTGISDLLVSMTALEKILNPFRLVYCKMKLARLDSMELGLENIIHDTDVDEEDRPLFMTAYMAKYPVEGRRLFRKKLSFEEAYGRKK